MNDSYEHDRRLLLEWCEWWAQHCDASPGDYDVEDLSVLVDAFLDAPCLVAATEALEQIEPLKAGGAT